MPFHVKFNWQQQSSKLGGWSTNFWSSLEDLSQVRAKANDLRTLLNAVTGAQVLTPSFTISSVTAPRRIENVETPTTAVSVTEATDADYPSTALFFKVYGAGGYSTGQWLRGIPDQNISKSGTYQPAGLYALRMGSVFGALKNPSNGWALRALDKNTAEKVIDGVALATGIVSCPSHGYGAAGATLNVRLMGFSSPKILNKVWRITVIDSNSFKLAFWQVPTETAVTGNNPVARAQVYTFVQIGEAKVIRASSHYTGRPTGLLGGRRRRRQTA